MKKESDLKALSEIQISKAISKLNKPIYIMILRMHLGLDNNIIIPKKEIAKKFGISVEYVKDIIYSSLKQIAPLQNYTIYQIINHLNNLRLKNKKPPIISHKANQLIITINNLKRAPKISNNGLIEKIFIEGTNQGSYYNNLRYYINNIRKKQYFGVELTIYELQTIIDYQAIKKALNPYRKKTQLIKIINEIHRLPKQKNKYNKPEYVFIDGTNVHDYYSHLKDRVNSILEKKQKGDFISLFEEECIEDYNEICATINKYSKKNQLIETIHQLHRIPKERKNNNGKPEVVFIQGTDQRTYYNNLKLKVSEIYKKLEKKQSITIEDKNILSEYEEIKNVINLYSKRTQLMKTIDELPMPFNINDLKTKFFEDETNQYKYYQSLCCKVQRLKKKIANNIPLTLSQKESFEDYLKVEDKIKQATQLYSKKTQLINSIHEIHHVPQPIYNKRNETAKSFIDGTDQGSYYYDLRNKIFKIILKTIQRTDITEKEKALLQDYYEIQEALDLYSKKTQLINTIHKLHKTPTPKSRNTKNKIVKTFEDGTDQGYYYNDLCHKAKKIIEKIKADQLLSLTEYENLQDYYEIQNILSFYPKRKQQNIELVKHLCQENKIDISKNPSILNKSYYEVYVKIKYLQDNNYPIIDRYGKIHNIIYISDINMQKKYNISMNELVKMYINGTTDREGNNYVYRRIA